MTIGTRLYTTFYGSKVGEDEFGNSYYTSNKNKRWVIYKGKAEASKVPANWHRWLHKTTSEIPSNLKKHEWEKPHLPNLSGTAYSYAPKGHIKKGHKREHVSADYVAWQPDDSA